MAGSCDAFNWFGGGACQMRTANENVVFINSNFNTLCPSAFDFCLLCKHESVLLNRNRIMLQSWKIVSPYTDFQYGKISCGIKMLVLHKAGASGGACLILRDVCREKHFEKWHKRNAVTGVDLDARAQFSLWHIPPRFFPEPHDTVDRSGSWIFTPHQCS